MRGMGENLKITRDDAMVYANEQTNQQEFLRRLGNSKKPHSCSMSAYSPPERENEVEEEAVCL